MASALVGVSLRLVSHLGGAYLVASVVVICVNAESVRWCLYSSGLGQVVISLLSLVARCLLMLPIFFLYVFGTLLFEGGFGGIIISILHFLSLGL